MPGVIVRTPAAMVGMISRQLFFQCMSRQFSREIYLTRPISVFFHADVPKPLVLASGCAIAEAARLALGRPQAVVYEPIVVEHPEGELRLLDMHVLLLAQNQTLLDAQAALVQSEKLASLGQLAAGVAHEINNPMSFVSTNMVVLRRDVESVMQLLDKYRSMGESLRRAEPRLASEAAELEEHLDLDYFRENLSRQFESSAEGLRRMRTIVRNLCDFARLEEGAFKEIDIQTALASTLEMVHHEIETKQIHLETHLSEMPPVAVHPGKINQVFLNLLLNAVQACRHGGNIRIDAGADPGQGVVVEIADDGCGISAEHMPHIFEPFFTTKPVGQGTGLGLAVSYGIVRDHGGTIEVDSVQGKGSVFRVTLPRALRSQGSSSPL
jgi:two-component system NtrC family sensor kinase